MDDSIEQEQPEAFGNRCLLVRTLSSTDYQLSAGIFSRPALAQLCFAVRQRGNDRDGNAHAAKTRSSGLRLWRYLIQANQDRLF